MGVRHRLMLVTLAVLDLSGCGSSPISAGRIEKAIATTFANRVELQAASLGLPPMRASDFAVSAVCRKQVPGSDSGAGEWTCRLAWRSPIQQPLLDTLDLEITTDGCYTASVEGESLGGPLLKRADGRLVKNLLHEFEGCFDTT